MALLSLAALVAVVVVVAHGHRNGVTAVEQELIAIGGGGGGGVPSFPPSSHQPLPLLVPSMPVDISIVHKKTFKSPFRAEEVVTSGWEEMIPSRKGASALELFPIHKTDRLKREATTEKEDETLAGTTTPSPTTTAPHSISPSPSTLSTTTTTPSPSTTRPVRTPSSSTTTSPPSVPSTSHPVPHLASSTTHPPPTSTTSTTPRPTSHAPSTTPTSSPPPSSTTPRSSTTASSTASPSPSTSSSTVSPPPSSPPPPSLPPLHPHSPPPPRRLPLSTISSSTPSVSTIKVLVKSTTARPKKILLKWRTSLPIKRPVSPFPSKASHPLLSLRNSTWTTHGGSGGGVATRLSVVSRGGATKTPLPSTRRPFRVFTSRSRLATTPRPTSASSSSTLRSEINRLMATVVQLQSALISQQKRIALLENQLRWRRSAMRRMRPRRLRNAVGGTSGVVRMAIGSA